MSIRRCRGLLLVLCGLLSMNIGCGTSAYQERMDKSLARLRSVPKSHVSQTDLYAYMPDDNALAGNRVNLRLPLVFATVFNEASTVPGTDSPLDPHKLFPAGVRLPGYARTYEAMLEDPDSRVEWPYYLYLAAAAAPADLAEQLENLRQQLQAEAPQTPGAWETVEIKTPDDQTRHLQKLRIPGEFFFDRYDHGNAVEWSKQEGVIELYLFAGRGHFVIVGWKARAGAEDQTHISELARLVASTLQIDGASPTSAE